MGLSIKHYVISFGFIGVVGLASTWLSSCAQSEAATTASSTTDDLLIVLNQSVQDIHTQVTNSAVDGTVAFKLNQIQSSLTGQGSSNSGNNVLALISKLSDDIGLMSERIVETEKLIVAVIAMQTEAATGVMANAKDSNGNPLLTLPSPIPNVFDEILRASSNSGPSSPLLSLGTANAATTTTPPDLLFSGNNASYELLISDNARFVSGYFNQVVNSNAITGAADSLTNVWANAIQSYSNNGIAPTQVYVAVKTIDANKQVSGISNSLLIPL